MDEITRPGIETYAMANSTPAPVYLREIFERTTVETGQPNMLVGPLEGRFLKLVVAMLRPRRVLEVGCFTGYSSLWMAEALEDAAEIVTLDIDPTHVAMARANHAAVPHGSRVKVIEGPALESMATLEPGFDMAFIDADKGNYLAYYEECLRLVRPGGFILADNTLWYAEVIDPAKTGDDVTAIRAFNKHVARDSRVEAVVLTVRDGITLMRKLG
jgi:caffeoyl-CoA O-methyltransferase